jgi:hypothetical protein
LLSPAKIGHVLRMTNCIPILGPWINWFLFESGHVFKQDPLPFQLTLKAKKISANSYVKSVSKSAAVLGCASMSVHQQVMYTNCSFIPYITGMDQVDPSRRSGLMKTFVAIEALGLSVAQRKAAKDWAAKFCEQKIRRFPFRHGLPPNRRSHGWPNYITYLKNRRY